MPMIYRTGHQEWYDYHNTDPLPPIIRAYDEAENELVSISAPERVPVWGIDAVNNKMIYEGFSVKGEPGYYAQNNWSGTKAPAQFFP